LLSKLDKNHTNHVLRRKPNCRYGKADRTFIHTVYLAAYSHWYCLCLPIARFKIYLLSYYRNRSSTSG